jgi:predicted metalloprotease with PDZ domain
MRGRVPPQRALKKQRLVFLIPVFLLLSTARLPAQDGVSYEVRYGTGGQERIQIRITPPQALIGPRPFVFPRAIPMGYGEQPLDRFVVNLRAFSGNREPLPSLRADGPRWIIGARDSKLTLLEYEVDLARMEREILSAADSSKVRSGYLGLLGYTVFGFVEGTEDLPVRLRITAPVGWRIFSTLDPGSAPDEAGISVQTRDFYALADSQILMGPALELRRLNARVPLYLAVYSEGEVDLQLLGKTVEEAFEAIASYFDGIPFAHYTVCQEFLRPVSERHDYGFSMEHLESGTFFFNVDQALTARSSSADVARARYNFAHHIAHAWIPKRAYGEGYFPFAWERAPVIDTIWFSEGFPQYAAIEALADTLPAAEAQNYREQMIENRFRSTLREAPDFLRRLSLIDLSRLASTRYSEDFRIGRSTFSRGGMMAAEMDERIRKASAGQKRLRDALRYLVARSARTGRAFRIEELPAVFLQATGVDTRSILERWLPPPDK